MLTCINLANRHLQKVTLDVTRLEKSHRSRLRGRPKGRLHTGEGLVKCGHAGGGRGEPGGVKDPVDVLQLVLFLLFWFVLPMYKL